jgi:[ribosomal protein S5]-alanine N-acetyltransferase
VLGGVGLHHLERGSYSGEIGYWIAREHRGHGYAAEAIEVLVRAAYRDLGVHRIEARIFTANHRSRRVAERAGFRYEGRIRDEVWKDDRWRSVLLFARLASDPGPARGSSRTKRAQPARRRR